MTAARPPVHVRFARARSRVLSRCASLPHGHAARCRLFELAGSPRGVSTAAELRSILALIR